VTTVRALLAQPPLAGRNVTLDALHCNPLTTAQIHHAQGGYVVQVKANQSALRTAVQTLAAAGAPLGTCQSIDKAHGRLEVRHAAFFSLASLALPARWHRSGLSAVVRVERTTTHLPTTKQTHAVAYYLTNQEVRTEGTQVALFTAIRGHWGCEADNWLRDVTWQEDQVPVHHSTQAHVLGLLRTLVVGLFRKARVGNMRAMLDDLADSPSLFTQLLRQVGFL
jgi:hypothetical protein